MCLVAVADEDLSLVLPQSCIDLLGLVLCTVASQLEGFDSQQGLFMCGVCMFYLCLCRFTPGALVSSAPEHRTLLRDGLKCTENKFQQSVLTMSVWDNKGIFKTLNLFFFYNSILNQITLLAYFNSVLFLWYIYHLGQSHKSVATLS